MRYLYARVAVALATMISHAGAVQQPGAQTQNCAGLQVEGVARSRTAATLYDLDGRAVGQIERIRAPIPVVDCEGPFLAIEQDGVIRLLKRLDVQTNTRMILPDCPENNVNVAANSFDRSSQGAGGGAICKPRS